MRRARLILEVAVAALIFLAGCGPSGYAPLRNLVVEEHALRAPPTFEPLAFAPIEGSAADTLAVHAAQRLMHVPDASVLIDGQPGMRARLGTEDLTATEHFDAADASSWVSVSRGGKEVYRIDTGMPSPINGLRGLWTYDQHWVLETAFVEKEAYSGRLSMDGALMVPDSARHEAFEFQLLQGRPFYFFERLGKIGFSYDDREVMLDYDEVPHYRCCSAAALNPIHARDMLAFFARRGAVWYYVEAGFFP